MATQIINNMFTEELVEKGRSLAAISRTFADDRRGHVLEFKACNSQHVLSKEALSKFLTVRNFVPLKHPKADVLAITHCQINEHGSREEVLVMDPAVWIAQFKNAANVKADLEIAVNEVVARWNELNGDPSKAGRREEVKRTLVMSTSTWRGSTDLVPRTTQCRLILDTFMKTREFQDTVGDAVTLTPEHVQVNIRYFTDWSSGKG